MTSQNVPSVWEVGMSQSAMALTSKGSIWMMLTDSTNPRKEPMGTMELTLFRFHNKLVVEETL